MYLGPDKVLTAVDENNSMVTITLESGRVLKWKKAMFEFCTTKEPSNPTELADSRALKAVQLLVKALLEVDVTLNEIPTIMVRMDNFLNEKLDAATARLWRKHMINEPKDNTLSGLQVLKERTVSDLDNYLVSNQDIDDGQNKDNNTGQGDSSSSKGDSSDTGNKES